MGTTQRWRPISGSVSSRTSPRLWTRLPQRVRQIGYPPGGRQTTPTPATSRRRPIRNMSIEGRAPRLAVLIDAENASPKIAEALFTEIAALGEASARRIYGDFASPQIAGWTKVLARFAIQPQQNFANTKGKNSGDIALVIDAMDLLHSGRFDGFCLVSSDADFTRLASRIREEGVDVYGFGEQKTPESFRQACTRFIYTENLSAAPAGAGAAAAE